MTFYIEYQNTRSLTEPGFMSDEIEYDVFEGGGDEKRKMDGSQTNFQEGEFI